MENWCYDKPTVYGFAKHYETGDPLPDEMFEKLLQQKTFGVPLLVARRYSSRSSSSAVATVTVAGEDDA
jgi:Zn-dependent oligopeptidase